VAAGVLGLEVGGEVEHHVAQILDFNPEIALHVSEVVLEEVDGAFDLDRRASTSYSWVYGVLCEVRSTAGAASPQN
jgi:hypothetical protein